MFRNYLTVALRNFARAKAYSIINILGLAVGMACCILIMQYIRYELAVDQHHTQGNQIYRVLREVKRTDGQSDFHTKLSGPLGTTMEAEIPEVEKTARHWGHSVEMKYKEQHVRIAFSLVDPTFFELFEFQMIGDAHPQTALEHPKTILITERGVKRFFGSEDPIGKTVSALNGLATEDYVVAGIIKDYTYGTFDFEFITTHMPTVRFAKEIWEGWLPGTWRMTEVFTLLHKDADIQEIESKLVPILEQKLGPEVSRTDRYRLQAFSRIHLYSETEFGIPTERTITQVYILGAVAGLVILIACVNFINLSTARSMGRAREVGTRKVFGAQRTQLIRQFMIESILITFLSGGLAFLLAHLALPSFNSFVRLELSLGFDFLPYLVGLSVIVGIFAGSYPAVYLSGVQPISILKGGQRSTKVGYLRRALVIFQFAVSILLIVGTIMVYRQLNYVSNRSLGYSTSGMVSVPMVGIMRRNPELAKTEFRKHPNVISVAGVSYHNQMNPSQVTVARIGQENGISVHQIQADSDFLAVYQLQLKAGHNYQMKSRRTLSRGGPDEFLINETAARVLGWDISSSDQKRNPVGQLLRLFGGDQLRLYKKKELIGTVVGVVEDFHYQSMHHPIRPLIIIPDHYLYALHLRIRTTDVSNTLAFFKETHQKIEPGKIFTYNFLDEKIAKNYEKERQTATLSFISAGLAIFVGCLGLFGLAAFAAEQRSKEIGIRKVLGASIPNILKLLLNEFFYLLALANLIALPIAYFLGRGWLNSFAYRIDLTADIFIISGLIVGILALLTIISQTLKAASANPVDVLRAE